MISSEFHSNRNAFPADELRQHVGNWVAFNLDGTRIVASAESLAMLEKNLADIKKDPTQVCFEFVHGADEGVFIGSEASACFSHTKAS
jgi:hypothetical protein